MTLGNSGSDAIADGLVHAEDLSSEEARAHAIRGSAVLAARGLAIRALGFAANILLARLLVPRDFGLVAVGSAIMSIAGFLTDGGMGTALIRKAERVSVRELQTLLGFQLSANIVFTALAIAVAIPFGRGGLLTAVMVSAMPVMAYKSPGVVVLERRLDYRRLATVEIAESLAQYGWGVAFALLDFGAWALATAFIARAVVGSVTILRLSPTRIIRPRLDRAVLRELLAFGLKFQAYGVVRLGTEQGLTGPAAAISGATTVGIWSLGSRILRMVSQLLFETLWRVSYPTMARLVARGEDQRKNIERMVTYAAVLTGAMLTPLVGAGPSLIPIAFGAGWNQVWDVIPISSLAILLSTPVSVSTIAYLLARGQAGLMLRCSIAVAVAWFGVTLPLLPVVSAYAFGIGWLVAAITESTYLGLAVRRDCGARVYRPLALPALAATTSALGGWWCSKTVGSGFGAVLAGSSLAFVLYAGILTIVDRQLVTAVIALARRGVRQIAR